MRRGPSRRSAVLVLAVLAACGTESDESRPPSRPAFWPIPVGEEAAALGEADPDFDGHVAALQAAAATADHGELAALLPPSALLDEWLAEQGLGRTLTIEIGQRARLDAGTWAVVGIRARGGHRPADSFGLAIVWPHGAARSQHAGAALFDSLLHDAAVDGEVFLDPALPWVRADLTLTLTAAAPGVLALPLDARALRVEIWQDGRPCRFIRAVDKLLVEPATAERTSRYRLRYEGTPAGTITTDPSVGRSVLADLWSEELGTRAGRIVVHHPADGVARSWVASRPSPSTFTGWRTTVLDGATGRLSIWMTREQGHESVELSVPGGVITLEVPAHEVAAWRRRVARAAAALAPLGRFPGGRVPMIAIPGFVESRQERGAVAVSVSPDAPEGVKVEVITHELAHLWFGGAVQVQPGDATRWWEAVAEYVSLWALTDDEALRYRAWLLARLAALPPGRERPSWPVDGVEDTDSDTLSYARGALLLAGLEARVGRPAMVRWLRLLVERRAGRRTDLADVLATVEDGLGAVHAGWLRRWLETTEPAVLRLEHAAIVDGRLHGALVADLPTPDDLRVTVALVDRAGTRLATHSIALTGPHTSIDLECPVEATHLVVCSDAMLPVRGSAKSATDSLALDDYFSRPLPGRENLGLSGMFLPPLAPVAPERGP